MVSETCGPLVQGLGCLSGVTPIKNLYLGRASCHLEGLIVPGGGYVAARKVVEYLGQEKWWPEPQIVKTARERGLL